MSLINGTIPQQNFELIRDRIGAILAEELARQVVLSGNMDLDVDVYVERLVRVNHSEMPLVNIQLARGDYAGQIAIQSDGTYRYNVECYTSAKSKEGEDGDSLAMIKLQRLLGVCRAIIENSEYLTLGFAPPSIMFRHVESIGVMDPNGKEEDATSSTVGRLVVVVKVGEDVELKDGVMWAGSDTVMKLGLTDKGYKFTTPQT